MLTEDEARAEEIAVELGRANSERRAREREVDTAAEAARRELPEHLQEAPGLVLAGEDWHPGVVGIVASRLVERHHRPVVVVSLDGEGGGRGSGRSIPGFDLLAALEACSEHLESFGGHRAAAGLALRAENLDAFREAFAAHATAVLGPDELRRTQRIDAMVGGVGLGLELAEELGQLAPFGMGNPGVRLMVPSARVSDVRTMGEGKHSRFSLHSGSHRALGVAFGRSSLGVEDDESVDAAVRLEVNHWNGSVEPRVVLNELYPLDDGATEKAEARLHSCECPAEEWWRRFQAELERPLQAVEPPREATLSPTGLQNRPAAGGVAGAARVLVPSGGSATVVHRRARLQRRRGARRLRRRLAPRRPRRGCHRPRPFQRRRRPDRLLALRRRRGRRALHPCRRRPGADRLRGPRPGPRSRPGISSMSSWSTRRAAPATSAGSPAPSRGRPGASCTPLDRRRGRVLAAVLDEQLASRAAVAALFRSLREAGEASGEELREALRGAAAHRRSPEAAARCFRVLAELGLVSGEPTHGAGAVGVVSSEGTDLERSAAFRAYRADHSEAVPFLARPKQP